jgi:hypothetical protein
LVEIVLEHNDGEMRLGENTLLVALDDTGHEEMVDDRYPVFGIGGCAVLVRDYQRLIEIPWNWLCKKHFGNVERPIHATDHFKNLTKEQIESLNAFFQTFHFFRIAVTVGQNAQKEIETSYIDLAGPCLLQRICDVGKWAGFFDRVVILFESSERIESQVIHSLSGKKIMRNNQSIDIELGVMPKSVISPMLEVADVIIHTAGSQTRDRNKGNLNMRLDYKAVFQSVDKKLKSTMEITKVVENKPTQSGCV